MGLGLSALVLAHLAAPPPGPGPIRSGALPPPRAVLARDVEALRRADGAAWVGTESYGVAAQLAAQRSNAAPIVPIVERQRYFDWQKGADLSGPA